MIYAYYTLITILLALVDTLRIRSKNRIPNPVGNNDISHVVSWSLAIVTAAALWFIIHGWSISWLAVIFAVGCAAIRGLFFDFFQNIFVNFFVFPRPINYISYKSSSLNEQRLTHVGFWWRRIISFGILIAVIVTTHFILQLQKTNTKSYTIQCR